MQKTKPEDTPKIIALAAAIIAVFAYVIYSFTKGSAASAEPERTAAAAPNSNQLLGQPFASSDPSTMTPGGSTPESAFSADSLTADATPLPSSARDPFQSPVAGPATNGGQVGAQYAPANIPQPKGQIATQVSNPDPGSVPMQVEAPPPSELELKGVVSGGSRPMALIRIGNTMLNVYEGQKITKDLIVKKIGVSSIELSNSNDMISLEVGTMLMASIVLPDSVVQANPSANNPAPVAGEATEMTANTPVYSAPEQGSAVRAATKAYGPS